MQIQVCTTLWTEHKLVNIYVVPISTVPSEFAFSVSNRVFNKREYNIIREDMSKEFDVTLKKRFDLIDNYLN
jgi:hypothetical protein